jgi:hypothetical protein
MESKNINSIYKEINKICLFLKIMIMNILNKILILFTLKKLSKLEYGNY